MTNLLKAFQQNDCPIGLLVFNQKTEGAVDFGYGISDFGYGISDVGNPKSKIRNPKSEIPYPKSEIQWLCTEANRCAEIFLEKSELVSKQWSDIFQTIALDTLSDSVNIQMSDTKWLSLSLMKDASDTARIVILHDVSAQQNSTKELEKKIDKLRNSNKDLEHFAYVASHDLREPLRKIVAFSERLNTKYASVLEGDGLVYLNRMIDATQRMQMFIDDLLMFSRFSRDTSDTIDVDLNDILRGVLSDFDMQIDSTKAVIHFEKLPTIQGVKTQMVQLFQNLVGNALKFRKPDRPPNIDLICVESPNTYQMTLRDNGIGFEEADAERIFTLFQRLNGRSEFEGTGIGLAICKKIVENHGGNITASGKPNVGSVFTITLPKW